MLWNGNECGNKWATGISRQPSSVQFMTDQKQPKNVEYFNYFGIVITNCARSTRDSKCRIATVKVACNKKDDSFQHQIGLKLKKRLVQWYIWNTALYGAGTLTLRKVYQKYMGSFEMWCCRRVEKISWPDHVRNEVVQRDKEERNMLQTMKRRQGNWTGDT